MTLDEKNRLTNLRKAGRSYTEIADALGISKNTVKTFCRRNGLTPEVEITPVEIVPASATDRLCPHCGKPVMHREEICGKPASPSRPHRRLQLTGMVPAGHTGDSPLRWQRRVSL